MEDIEHDFLIEHLKLNNTNNLGDCHKTSQLIYNVLKKKGYNVKLKHGVYIYFDRKIAHSWIEYEDKILETDCRQLRKIYPEESNEANVDDMSKLPCDVLSKKQFSNRYQEIKLKKKPRDYNLSLKKEIIKDMIKNSGSGK